MFQFRSSALKVLRTPAIRQPVRSLRPFSQRRISTARHVSSTVVAAAVLATSVVVASTLPTPPPIQLDRDVNSTSPSLAESTVSLEGTTFLRHKDFDGRPHSLLGVGVRTVSFFGFNVYTLGIYLADDDHDKAKQLIGGASFDTLMDVEKGTEIVAKLLDAGVKIAVRIVPVRNTDFGHLRDGFIRTIMAHPWAKIEQESDAFGEGIAEFKRVLSRKKGLRKHRILHLVRDSKGVLTVTFFDSSSEQSTEANVLGRVEVPVVSKLLFLQYMSGAQPSSPSARAAAMQSLAEL